MKYTEKTALEATSAGKINGMPSSSKAAYEDYITIPTLLYTGLIRDSGLLDVIIRIMTDNHLHEDTKVETLAAVLDLPYEIGEQE